MNGFSEGRERARALAASAGVLTFGGSLGVLLGGLITAGSWRWVLLINIPVGAVAIVLTLLFVPRQPRVPGRIAAAVLSGVIMMFGACLLVFAFVRIASGGRGAEIVILFTIAIAAYAVTLLIEARARQPLAPLRLFFNPGRAGALAAQLLLLAGVAGSLYFLTQFLQDVRGFSALQTALAFLPLTVLLTRGTGWRRGWSSPSTRGG
jgi:MFS family permease